MTRKIIITLFMVFGITLAVNAEEKVWTKSYDAVYYELTDYESSNAEDIIGYVSDYASEAGLPLTRVKKISNTQWEAINAIMSCYNYSSDEYYQFVFETQATDYMLEIRIDANNKVWAILYMVESE